jgi:hypothetical protein
MAFVAQFKNQKRLISEKAKLKYERVSADNQQQIISNHRVLRRQLMTIRSEQKCNFKTIRLIALLCVFCVRQINALSPKVDSKDKGY